MLLFILRRDGIYKPAGGWLKFAITLLLAVTVMLLVLLLLINYVGGAETWHQQDWWRVFSISVCIGGFVHMLAVFLPVALDLQIFVGQPK